MTKGTAARNSHSGGLPRSFTEFASRIAHVSGQPVTFALSCALILVWAVRAGQQSDIARVDSQAE